MALSTSYRNYYYCEWIEDVTSYIVISLRRYFETVIWNAIPKELRQSAINAFHTSQ